MSDFRMIFLFLFLFSLFSNPFSSVMAGEKVKKSYLGEAPMYQMLRADAKANIILFNGGPGWWGNLKSKNFLIRERKNLFSRGLNVFIFPNKKKKYKMTYADRLKNIHISRIRNLIKDIKSQNNLPIFLAGISRGAVSVGKFISQHGREINGAALLSGIYINSEMTKKNKYSMQRVIGTSVETNILVQHHENDCCKVCQPSSAKQFFEDLEITSKALQMISGGSASGGCNGPFHHHGFEGVEDQVVEKLVSWVESLL